MSESFDTPTSTTEAASKASVLLEAKGVTKTFSSGFWGKDKTVAVDNVDLDIAAGEIHGLIGGSGSGKTTLSRIIMGFVKPDSGEIIYDGRNLVTLKRSEWRSLRKDIQMIFQNPHKAFNPRFSVYECCAEPLRLFGLVKSREEERTMVYNMLDSVGITRDQMNKFPHEISGGQAQRVAIVRALALNPKLLICDEPTSMLDVSVQAQIVDILKRINKEQKCTMLCISHDLDVIRYLCDSVSVMNEGRVIEQGLAQRVFGAPKDPFTKGLMASAL